MSDKLEFADRSERGKLAVTGPQSAWFLDQILTQSFQDMSPGGARDAALITVHGRMVGYLEAVATADGFLLHFEPELRAVVPQTLQRYVLATDVQIEDLSEKLGLVVVVGSRWREGAQGVHPLAVHPTSALGVDAGYLWLPRSEVPDAIASLELCGGRPVGEEVLEAIRIAHGMPRWGRDMDEKTFPQEAGIDERAVHYHKGCYLGQEAMAKIHFRGKVNRRLARLRATTALTIGAEVALDGANVGRITSASDGTALAMVRSVVEPGTEVTVEGSRAEVIG
jgi:tRNA-modifying protein YgfZ